MSGEPKGQGRASRSAAYVLALSTLLNFVNYIDRFILAAVLPRIKSELVLNDFQLGMLANAFLVAYFITSPLFGRLGDRGLRPRLNRRGRARSGAWPPAAGLARTSRTLVVARAGVGIGEAAYATIAPALLADFFPPERRGRAFAIFYVGDSGRRRRRLSARRRTGAGVWLARGLHGRGIAGADAGVARDDDARSPRRRAALERRAPPTPWR